ncbi:hypothetical protein N9N67_03215 [Bacteriovoracaceae bacterium]|nr:hypothetical protein [Bacteriovoracaceae bacterium]
MNPLVLVSTIGFFLFSYSFISNEKGLQINMNLVMLSISFLITYSIYLVFKLNILEQCIFLILLVYLSLQIINHQIEAVEKVDFYFFFFITLFPVISIIVPAVGVYIFLIKIVVLLGLIFSLDVLSKKDLKFYQYTWQRVFGSALLLAFLVSKLEL